MSRKKSVEDWVLWGALVIGGGYLVYRLFNQPAAGRAVQSPAALLPAPTTQQQMDTALTNIVSGATDIFA